MSEVTSDDETEPPTEGQTSGQTDEQTNDQSDEQIDNQSADQLGEIPACLCPVSDVLDLLSKKYAIQIVCAVGVLEPVRYRRLADQLGDVSSSTLSTRLEELVDAGILAREQYDEIPPRVEYRLTDAGHELADRLEPVVAWAQDR